MDLQIVLAGMIILMGLCIAYSNFRYALRYKVPWRWIKFSLGLIGVIYTVFYGLHLAGLINAMPYTRPLLVITLAIILAGSLASGKRYGVS